MTFVDLGKMPIHKVHVLPARVQELIMLLMRELGLVFGCFDLILTPEENIFSLRLILMVSGFGLKA